MPEEKRRIEYCDVCIVGGGVAGSALAQFLRMLNNSGGETEEPGKVDKCEKRTTRGGSFITYRLFDRDENFNEQRQGYGLTMQQGSSPLRSLGLENMVRDEDTPNDVHYAFKSDGSLIAAFGRMVNHHLRSQDQVTNDEDTRAWRPATMLAEEASKERPKIGTKASADACKKKKKRQNLHLPRKRLRELLIKDLPMDWGWVFHDFARINDTASSSSLNVLSENEAHGHSVTEGSNNGYGTQRPCTPVRAQEEEDAYRLEVELRRKGTLKGSVTSSEKEESVMLVRCKVLVGADGIHSKVRKKLLHLPHQAQEYDVFTPSLSIATPKIREEKDINSDLCCAPADAGRSSTASNIIIGMQPNIIGLL